jgi:hypothetical protein
MMSRICRARVLFLGVTLTTACIASEAVAYQFGASGKAIDKRPPAKVGGQKPKKSPNSSDRPTLARQLEAFRKNRAPRTPITAANVSHLVELINLNEQNFKVRWHPKRDEFGLLCFKSKVEIFDAKTMRPLADRGIEDEVFDFAFAPGGDGVAVSSEGSLETVNFEGEKPSLGIHEEGLQPGVAYSPDGKLLATGGQ